MEDGSELALENGSEDEPDVHGDGGKPAVVARHDSETLEERLAVVEGGLAFLGVVGHNHVEVVEWYILSGSGLHNADAPIDIGRVTVAEVVGRGDGEVGTGVEGLVADKHAVAEGLPSEMLWWSKTTVAEEMAFGIDDISVAI